MKEKIKQLEQQLTEANALPSNIEKKPYVHDYIDNSNQPEGENLLHAAVEGVPEISSKKKIDSVADMDAEQGKSLHKQDEEQK